MHWLLLILPLLAAIVTGFVTRRNGTFSAMISTASVATTLAIAVILQLKGENGSYTFVWASAGEFSLNIGLQ